MKLGFNIYPLHSGHKNRGVGYYTLNLLDELKKRKDIEIIEFLNLPQLDKVDVIFYPWFDLFFATLPVRKKAPTVVMIHDTIPLLFPENYPLGIKGRINFLKQKFSLKKCSFVITNSNDSKKNITKFLGVDDKKIKVVPLAPSDSFKVLTESEKLRLKRKYKLPDSFILYVGDANFVKNLPFLIEGFNQLKRSDKFSDLKLILVGEVFLKKLIDDSHIELAPLGQTNKLINKYQLASEIIKPGLVETVDLVGFYNLATAYVQPSLYEGFGLPLLEAMRCGCPVISSNKGALPEVGGSAAVYFEPTRLDKFTTTLSQVLEDKSLQAKLSKLGRERAAQFSWERVADETIEVFEQAIKK